jgi:hypothetical protein
MITTRVSETFTYTFRGGELAGSIKLVRGVGNASPDTAVRYHDVVLPDGTTAMLKVTPESIGPLRVDRDGDGTFETEIKPDAYVTGQAAQDIDAPTFCFGESRKGEKILVTITTVDSSGVGEVYYSLDPVPGVVRFRPYTGPIEVDASRTPVVTAHAKDNVGNRGVQSYNLKGEE